jgi:hypothetical protein
MRGLYPREALTTRRLAPIWAPRARKARLIAWLNYDFTFSLSVRLTPFFSG